jgi:Zn-finger nucleic acid-binding protein
MHCGRIAKDMGEEDRIVEDRLCPRCETPMKTKRIGEFSVLGCDECDGLFVSSETFEMMQERNDRKIFPADGIRKGVLKWENQINYVKCPVCNNTMARTNFARTSGILVDICRDHGTWFDPGELVAVMLFISANRHASGLIDALGLRSNTVEDGVITIFESKVTVERGLLNTSWESPNSSGGRGGFILAGLMEKLSGKKDS